MVTYHPVDSLVIVQMLVRYIVEVVVLLLLDAGLLFEESHVDEDVVRESSVVTLVDEAADMTCEGLASGDVSLEGLLVFQEGGDG
jgi:hypothetical protein